MNNSKTQTLALPEIKPWIIWLIASSFYMYEFIHRVALSVMIDELQVTFQATGAEIGNLSASYYYAYAFMQIPVGLLLDRYGTRFLLSFSALSIAFGSYLFGITSDLHVAQAGRLFIGAGSAFSFAACLKLSASWFHTKNFALIVGLTNLMGTLGAMLGGKPLAMIVNAHGWRVPVLWGTSISLLFVLFIWFCVEDKKNNTYIAKKIKSKPSFMHTLKQVISNRQLWYIAIFGCCMVIPIAVLSELWGVDYLVKKFNISKEDAAFISSCTFIGIAFGGPIIGFLSEQIKNKLLFMRIGNTVAIVTTVFMIYSPYLNPLTLSILHFVFGFSTSSMLLCFSLNRNHVPEYAHATTIGLTNSVIMFGSVLFQPIIGSILDILNSSEYQYDIHFGVEQYQSSFICLPICQIVGCLILFLIKDNIKTRRNFN